MLERKPARERRFAQQQHGAGILVAGRDVAERSERDRIQRPFTEVRQSTCNQVPFVDCIKKLDHPHDLEPRDHLAPIRRWLGRGPQDNVFVTEARARELTIVSGGITRRSVVMGARLFPSSQRLRRAPLPIA